MKRLVFLISVALVCMGATFYVLQGKPYSATYTLVDNAAITLQAAFEAGGGTWANPSAPIAFTIQSETHGLRIGFGGDTPSVDNVGTLFEAGTSGRFAHPEAASTAKICPATAGRMPKVHIIVER